MTGAGRTAVVLLVAVAVAAAASAQDRVGQLTAVTGEVVVKRAASGSDEVAQQVGPRVRNGSLFAGDELRTGAGASATLVFSDSSRLVLKPATRITVREVDLSAVLGAGQVTKPLGRTIKILAGDVVADIVANPAIATAFETPTGVAAVKGTTLEIGVDGGEPKPGGSAAAPDDSSAGLTGSPSTSVSASEGVVTFHEDGTGIVLSIGAGNAIVTRKDDSAGGVSVGFPDDNASSVAIELASGVVVSATAGSAVRTRTSGFATRLEVERGRLDRADGSTVDAGAGLGFANSDFRLPAGTPVSVSTEKGAVELLNLSNGLRAEVKAGYAIQLTGSNGGVNVILPATNPGAMALTVGQRSLQANASTNLNLTGGRTSLDVEVASGEVELTNQDGSTATIGAGGSQSFGGDDGGSGEPGQQSAQAAAPPEVGEDEDEDEEDEEDAYRELNCGECGVQVGDVCQDDSSLCQQDCYADRQCQAGRCTGGRRLTSREDPNCP